MFIDTEKPHTEAAHELAWGMHLVGDLERAVGSQWNGTLRTWDWEDVAKCIGLHAARELTERGFIRTGPLFRYAKADGSPGYVTLRQWKFTDGGRWMLGEVLRERAAREASADGSAVGTVVRTTGRA